MAKKTGNKKAAVKTNKAAKAQPLQCHRNSAGKWVYPQGNANITIVAQAPTNLGSNQLVHYTALKAAFGKSKTLPLPTVIAALGKANLGRRTLRRAGRAQCYSFVVK